MVHATAIAEIVIRRPIEMVRAQFLDLQHHMANDVHPEIEIVNHERDGDSWLYTQGSRVFGRMRRNRVRLGPMDTGSVRLAFLHGPDQGTAQVVTFEALGGEATQVRSTTTIPLRGLMSLLRAFVENQATKVSARALMQDRSDLERYGYPRAAKATR